MSDLIFSGVFTNVNLLTYNYETGPTKYKNHKDSGNGRNGIKKQIHYVKRSNSDPFNINDTQYYIIQQSSVANHHTTQHPHKQTNKQRNHGTSIPRIIRHRLPHPTLALPRHLRPNLPNLLLLHPHLRIIRIGLHPNRTSCTSPSLIWSFVCSIRFLGIVELVRCRHD